MKQQTLRVSFPALANLHPLFDRLGACIQEVIDELILRFRQHGGGGLRASRTNLGFSSGRFWVVRVLESLDSTAASRHAMDELARELRGGGFVALSRLGPACEGRIDFAE